jgi:hypothetical protein
LGQKAASAQPFFFLMTEDQAREQIEQILAEKWTNERSGILGAQLKATLRSRAQEMGSNFDEKALGYTSFSRFIQDLGIAVVKYRGSNDILIASKDHPEALNEQDLRPPRIRRAFWDAFVRFQTRNEFRGYNPNTDEIVIGTTAEAIANSVVIEPIPKELQLEWRREFVQELGPESPLAEYEREFTPQNGFTLFSHILSRHSQFRIIWSKVFSGRVNSFISEWAKRYGVRDGIWLESYLGEIEDTARAKLYAILDQVPIEDLVELRIPLKWLLEQGRSRS